MRLKGDSFISNINKRCAMVVSHVFFFLNKTHLLIALKGIDSSISTFYVSTHSFFFCYVHNDNHLLHTILDKMKLCILTFSFELKWKYSLSSI